MYEASKLIEAVRELTNEYPYAIYNRVGVNSCLYTRGDVTVGDKVVGCGCIMGQAILKSYPESKEELKNEDIGTVFSIGGIIMIWGFDSTPQESSWLEHVQSKQDSGETWSEAVKLADVAYPLS